MPEKVATLERPSLNYTEEVDHLFVDLSAFQVKFHKGTAGYDEIWKEGRQIVANVRWLLKDGEGKQVGIPQRIEWEVVDDYTLIVKRFYTDYLGTDFCVIQECRSDDRVKTTVEGVVGKSSTFSLMWSASGIASTSIEKEDKKVSCFEEETSPDVQFDFSDVYEQLGDVTTVDVSARERKADFSFALGILSIGQTFRVDPSTVGTSTGSWATGISNQRKCFYANGRFWVFYSNGTNIVFRTSTDGSSWSGETILVAAAPYSCSIWFDGTYFHYVYVTVVDGEGIYYRRGTPNANGSVSWSAVEQTAVAGAGGILYYNPFISVDSSGYAWISYRRRSNSSYYPYVTKSGNNDGTWGTTPDGFPYQLSTASVANWRTSIIPLTSGKMLATYTWSSYLHVQRWEGSEWGTEVSTTSVVNYEVWSIVAQGDDAHIVFKTSSPYPLKHIRYIYSSNSFSAETTIETGYAAEPTMSIDGNNLYVFWPEVPTADHIFYRKWNGSSWEARVDWIDESTDTLSYNGSRRLTSFYQIWGDYIGLLYMTKAASPFDIRFAFLYLPVVAPTVTTQAVDGIGID